MKRKRYRNVVVLNCFGARDEVVERKEIPYDQYYDGGLEIIDSEAYRSNKAVRRVMGEIYDSRGHLQQSFENFYSESGEYIRSRVVHEDGTVIED